MQTKYPFRLGYRMLFWLNTSRFYYNYVVIIVMNLLLPLKSKTFCKMHLFHFCQIPKWIYCYKFFRIFTVKCTGNLVASTFYCKNTGCPWKYVILSYAFIIEKQFFSLLRNFIVKLQYIGLVRKLYFNGHSWQFRYDLII